MNKLYLKKYIPGHYKTINFHWIKKEFMVMSPEYRDIRKKCGDLMDTCFWCKYKFKDGDMMGLGCPEKGRNKVLCQSCVNMAHDDTFNNQGEYYAI
jgi:hypothetical protein